MRRRDEADNGVSPEDRRLIDAISGNLRPQPMDATRRAVFRRKLEERIERRAHAPWLAGLALAATAAAAAVLWISWLAMSQAPGPEPVEVAAPVESATQDEEVPVLHAFVEPEAYGDENSEPQGYLPDDYLVLASLLDLDTGEP